MKSAPIRRIVLAFVVVATLAALDGTRWWRAERINAAVDRSASAGGTAPEPWSAELQFAAALAAARDEQVTRAVALYRQVAAARPDLAPAALFNAANALQREAQRLASADNNSSALPLLELAKETYREVLRIDHGHWAARYNLERALRAAPEGEGESDESAAAPLNSERALTTMRSFTLGLP